MKPDIYVWKARRCPMLLVALPLALVALATFPDADWKFLLPVCTFCGLFMLFAQTGRDRGYAKQDGLFASWGGKPTTAMLRHRESAFDEITLGVLHDWLATVTGVPKPSKRKESASPDDTDDIYEGYVRHLRDATRDKQQYPLVFDENVSYGFRRNTWGLRPFGIAAVIVGVIGGMVNIIRFADGPPLGLAVAVTVVNLLLLAFWVFWVSPAWVRIPAQAYAERLMEVALRMARASPKSPTPTSVPESTPATK